MDLPDIWPKTFWDRPNYEVAVDVAAYFREHQIEYNWSELLETVESKSRPAPAASGKGKANTDLLLPPSEQSKIDSGST